MLPTLKNRIFLPNPVNDFFESNFNSLMDNEKRQLNLPAVNIKEDEKKFEIHVAVPGRNKEDIKIELDKDILTISSEQELMMENENFTRKEFSIKPFERRFSLPDSVDAGKIKASNNLGILVVEIPKKVEKAQKPKQIKVA
jgi:HSP20 family protein